MPELPEVETTLRGILPHIEKQTIAEIIVRERRFRWPIPLNFCDKLIGKKIDSLERRAKYLLLNIKHGSIIIHLGMSGHLRILENPQPAKKHDHVDIIFRNKKVLRFTDHRRFGAMLFADGNAYEHFLLNSLGPEPLSREFSSDYLLQKAKGKNLSIKAFIMDSKIVVGVGNIYAAEALFDAGIHPTLAAGSISKERMDRLAKSIKQILRNAIKRGGTTLRDFTNSDGKPGYFSNQLKVYGRAGLPCVKCKSILKLMRLGQRSTVYCECCQHFNF